MVAVNEGEDGLHHPHTPQQDLDSHIGTGGSQVSHDPATKAASALQIPAASASASAKSRASLEQLNDKFMFSAKDMTWKKKTWLLMEEPSLHPIAEKVHHVYSCLILLSVLTMVLGTLNEFEDSIGLEILEICFNVLFSIEASLRVLCAPQKKALLYSMYMWMDILAVVPFYVLAITQTESDSHPMLELLVLLVPILRLLKVTRQSSGWRLLILSLIECLPPLMVPAFLLLLMVVFSSCVLFWMDKHTATEDDGGPAFTSIPHAMWFTICTVSTVGYGDVSPNSDLAKSGASMLILLGVCYMAMPLAIVGNTFSDVWTNRDKILIAEKAKVKFADGGFTKEDLQELFAMTDADGSGTLSRKEFIQLINAFNLGFTRVQIKKLFRTIDEDSTGSVNFKEFGDFLFPDIEIEDEDDVQGQSETSSPDPKPAPSVWAKSTAPNNASPAPNDKGVPSSSSGTDGAPHHHVELPGGALDAVKEIRAAHKNHPQQSDPRADSKGKTKEPLELRQTVRELQGCVDFLRQDMRSQFAAITRHLGQKQEGDHRTLNGKSSAG